MPASRARVQLRRGELKRLVEERTREAAALLASRNYSGAYYLAGYIVELAIKVCIANEMQRHVIPARQHIDSIYTHDLEKLIGVAELTGAFRDARSADTVLNTYWDTVKIWNQDARYQRWSRVEATELYRAITDEQHGVLRWVKLFW